MITELQKYYIPERVKQIDIDFLETEEESSNEEDTRLIVETIKYIHTLEPEYQNLPVIDNPHNSILLYLTGLTDTFDFIRGRSDTIGGSPPDIDIDFSALERDKAIRWVSDHWGKENIASILTISTFKPKSILDSYFRVMIPSPELDEQGNVTNLRKIQELKELKKDIRKKIPESLFGKEATLEEIIKGDKEKGFLPHPELLKESKYAGFIEVARKLEGMVRTLGGHAAGVVISDNPVTEVLPVLTRSEEGKSTRKSFTQFDMGDTETLGLIKFDFLVIVNGDIIKRTCKLIEDNHGIVIDSDHLPDRDKKAYAMMHLGLLTGIFQMETSESAKILIQKVKPKTIREISDISSLNRPGPLTAGLDETYITNKDNGYAPDDLPESIAEILKGTYHTLIYQEQLMEICHKVAGFTLQESDDIRRSMGKKKKSILEQYETRFIEGCVKSGLSEPYSQELWQTLLGFADYCLAGSTLIKTPFGTISIQEIVENKLSTLVCSTDRNLDHQVGVVNQWHSRGNKQVYEYKLEDKSTVTCTSDHKFLCEDGKWRMINEIYEQQLELKQYE
jgi:DNA polymerase III subunit alpha